MPTIEQQVIARRRSKAQGTAKRLAFQTLRYQVHQRLLKKQNKTSHTSSVARTEGKANTFVVNWKLSQRVDFTAFHEFLDRYNRKDWFEFRQQQFDKFFRSQIVLLGFHDDRLICYAGKSAQNVLQNLLVHPDYRGCGIGQVAIELIGPWMVRSMSNQSQGDPEGFYAKAAFRSTGVRVGRKKNMLLMIKDQA